MLGHTHEALGHHCIMTYFFSRDDAGNFDSLKQNSASRGQRQEWKMEILKTIW